jgi:hypothetical protein
MSAVSNENYSEEAEYTGAADEDEEMRDDDFVPPVPSEHSCISEQVYVESGNDKKVLYLLCVGLRLSDDEDSPFLLCFDTEPWSTLPRNVMRPKNADFGKEIGRRSEVLSIIPTPRPLNWSKSQKLQWLQANPIRHATDISFLRSEVLRLKEVLVTMAAEQEQQQQQQQLLGLGGLGVSRGGQWRGSVPYLRLILCFTEDDIRHAFLTRARARSRQELDARSSENR